MLDDTLCAISMRLRQGYEYVGNSILYDENCQKPLCHCYRGQCPMTLRRCQQTKESEKKIIKTDSPKQPPANMPKQSTPGAAGTQ